MIWGWILTFCLIVTAWDGYWAFNGNTLCAALLVVNILQCLWAISMMARDR